MTDHRSNKGDKLIQNNITDHNSNKSLALTNFITLARVYPTSRIPRAQTSQQIWKMITKSTDSLSHHCISGMTSCRKLKICMQLLLMISKYKEEGFFTIRSRSPATGKYLSPQPRTGLELVRIINALEIKHRVPLTENMRSTVSNTKLVTQVSEVDRIWQKSCPLLLFF